MLAAKLTALIEVLGVPQGAAKIKSFGADVDQISGKSATASLGAEVNYKGFDEFDAVLSEAKGADATARLGATVDSAGFRAFDTDIAAARAAAAKPIIQKLEFDANPVAGALGGSADRAAGAIGGGKDDLGPQNLTNAMFALRQWQLAHPKFWNVGPTGTALPGGGEDSSALAAAVDKLTAATVAKDAVASAGGNGGGSGGFWGSLLGGAGSGGGGGGLRKALWGAPGRGAPWWLGGGALAGAGTLGAFAGFGAEHVLFSGLGLLGSAGAATLGGGLVGAGALAQTAVGGGSDLAVMKTTIAQTKELGTATEAVNKAMELYGAHSRQAALAVANLKLLEKELGGGRGVKAEAKLAEHADALGEFWTKATQGARVNAAHVLDQVVGLGHAYVPKVAHAAEENLAIIDKGLKPLFSWLKGPQGMGVFNQLEDQFKKNLPTALGALNQAVQFVLKTLSVTSQYTGGFVEGIDKFFTKWNEPQNFAKWKETIAGLVGDFHLWLNLIKVLGQDIFGLFSNDAHTGNAIVISITHMLEKVREWEKSTSGKGELHNIFQVHKEEILALLKIIPPLVVMFKSVYLTIAPPLVEAATEILTVIANILTAFTQISPITRWAAGIALIGAKLGLLKVPFAALGGWLGGLLAKLPLIGGFFGTVTSETEGLTVSTDALTAAIERLTGAYAAMGTVAGGAASAQDAAAGGFGGVGAAGEGAAMNLGATSATRGALGLEGETVGAGVGGGVLAGVGTKLSSFADTAASSVFAKAGAVAAGYFAAEFGARLVAPGALEGQSLEQALFHGFNTEGVAKTEARALAGTFAREISHALADGGNAKALESASHNRARTISQQQTEAIREEASVLDALKSGLVTRMGDIIELARKGSTSAAAAFGEGTPQWRKATADNLQAVIESIKAGEHAGLITTEEGQKKIGQYLREANLVTGQDPFHIASAFTQTWKEAGGVTEAGISTALAELRKMPPVSQAIAEQTMLHQVKAFEDGGKVAKDTFSRLRSAIVTELQRTRQQGGSQVEHFASEMGGSFGSLSIAAAEAFQNIGGNLGALLSKLGAHNPLQSFTVKFLHTHGAGAGSGSKYLNQVPELGKQRGGHINQGAPTGDSVPAMLERGEYVLNRNAVAAVGTQNLDALNYGSHSRFQKGGQAGRLHEPHISGSGPLHDAGQGAVHDAYGGATAYLGKHKPKSGTGGVAGYVSGGGGPVVAQMGRILLASGYNKIGAAGVIGNALQESGWNPASVGSGGGGLLGFTTGAISLAALQAFAKKKHKPWTDVGLQMEFFLDHEYGIRPGVNSQKSAGAAAAYFMNNWERPEPSTENQARRELGARIAFAKGYQHGGLVDPRQHLTKAQKDEYLAWKWGKRLAEGGLVGATETELHVPKSASSGKGGPSASEAVQWEMRHLGQSQPWASEYPGEWCGAFQAGAMRAVGLTPPSGYPAAASWANYGTNLGKAHVQAGAIIDYGSQHVAMAISASEMVQGNDVNGVVGTSSIVSEVGGSPITAVRWPKYGSGPGAGSTPTETVPAVFHGARTKALSFPSQPKTVAGAIRELNRWSAELKAYERAAALAKGKPKTQAAIQQNITRIHKYLNEVGRTLNKLRLAVAKKHATKHFQGQLGKITGYEVPIAKAQRRYEEASQLAEQIVAKEPKFREGEEGGEQTGELIRYVNEKETPAYGRVLASEAEWRNLILGAEHKAAGNWAGGKIGGLEGNWEGRITNLVQNESSIESFAKQTAQEVAAWHKAHGKQALPKDLKARADKRTELLGKLPLMQFKEAELRKVLGEGRESFYPGGASILQPAPPLEGSGSFEDALKEVQGLHWPDQHETLATLPAHSVAGKFGGAIWQTQETIEELGFNVAEMLHSAFSSIGESFSGEGEGVGSVGGSAVAEHTERERLLEEQLKQANQRLLVRQVGEKTLTGFPYAGAFATGGLIAAKVGERGPEIATFPSGTRIHNAGETRSMLQPNVRVHVHGDVVSSHPDPVQVFLDDQRVDARIKHTAKSATGVGRPFAAGGARL